jgi:PurA ssDNA and RNA-binding protein
MDTQLRNAHIRIERKRFTFDLKENLQGAFLRITEEVNSGRRNAIVIPLSGLELFRDSLNEVLQFHKSPVASSAVLPLGQPKAETSASSDSSMV